MQGRGTVQKNRVVLDDFVDNIQHNPLQGAGSQELQSWPVVTCSNTLKALCPPNLRSLLRLMSLWM